VRWIGPFPTANIAGLMLAVATLVFLVAVVIAWRRGWRLAAISGVIAGVVPVMILSVATQSRAGLLATVAGLTLLAWRWVVPWRLVSAWVACYLAIAVFTGGHVLDRVADGVRGDASMAGRWTLWRATLALISDQPWRGVGVWEVAPVLDAWYLPESLRGRFGTALNDCLTITAGWGVPVTAVLVAGLATLLISACSRRGPRDEVFALAGAVAAAHVVAGVFQFHPWWAWWWWTAMPTVLVLLWRAWFHRRHVVWRRSVWCGVGGAVMLMATVLVVGRWCAMAMPYQTRATSSGAVVGHARDREPWGVVWLGTMTVGQQRWAYRHRQLALTSAGLAVAHRGDWPAHPPRVAGLAEGVHIVVSEGDTTAALRGISAAFLVVLVDPLQGDAPEPDLRHPDLVVSARFAPFGLDAGKVRLWWPQTRHHMEPRAMVAGERLAALLTDMWGPAASRASGGSL